MKSCNAANKNIIAIFEAVCSQYPHAIALESLDLRITFGDLMREVNKLSQYLKEYYEATKLEEFKRGKRIGIYIDRSPELIIAILAVLKLDCVYVPINVAFPAARVSYILQDAELDVVLTKSELQPKINRIARKSSDEILMIEIDDVSASNFNIPYDEALFPCESHDLGDTDAYLLYTSGTTGLPKGILIRQEGLINVADFEKKQFRINSESKVLGFAHCSFDASAWEIFGALLSGATYCIASEEALIPGENLAKTVTYFSVTHLTLPPSALNEMSPDDLHSLQCVVSAGEPLSLAVMKKWALDKWHFFNAYGPTEATICSMITECHQADSDIYLGQAIQNVGICLVDENRQCVSRGEIGEIAICGIGLAREYYKNKLLTEKSFVKLKAASSERYYLSGDYALCDDAGNIHYKGRKDDLIKLRGYRIELGEITSVALKLHGIALAKAAVKELNGRDTLVLYYSKDETQESISDDEIKKYLSKHLASYMMPQLLVKLEKFELTHNGKIDKNKLPDLCVRDNATNDEATMGKIISIWQKILGISQVGPNDDFFDIGGHSLLVTQVVMSVKQKLSVTITMHEFMINSLLSDLTILVEKKLAIKNKSGNTTNKGNIKNQLLALEIDEAHAHEPFPLTDIQQAYYLGRSGEFELSQVSTNIYREFRFEVIDLKRLEKAVNLLIERHGMLRCVFHSSESQQILQNVGSYKIQVYHFQDKGSDFLSHLGLIRNEMSLIPLPVDKAPIFNIRATVLPDVTYLHFVMDALIVDGWSYFVFFNELEKLYNNQFDLKPLSLSFRDYVMTELKVEKSEQFSQDKEYWIKRLNDFPIGPTLPTLSKPSAVDKAESDTLRCIIEPKQWLKVCDIADKHSLSPTILLLTIFSDVLSHWTADDKFVINVTLFNRLPLHEQVNEIIGDFSSLELLEVDHTKRHLQNFVGHARQIKAQLYEDLDHRLFSGVAVQRALAQHLGHSLKGSLMPIVFTCFLENENKNNSLPQEKMFSFKNLEHGTTQSSQVWLDFKVYEEKQSLILEWDYIKNLLMPDSVKAMFTTYCDIILGLSASSSEWLDIGPSSHFEAERFFNWIEPVSTGSDTLSGLVCESAKKFSSNVAIIDGHNKLSYLDLHRYAMIVATELRAKKVATPNTLIAVCMAKCHQQIVAALAILYAGAAYVPIDPSLPKERIAQLIADAKATMVISQEKYTEKLDFGNVILLDDLTSLDKSVVVDVEITNAGSDLAYVIYTSGSTGMPKGVMMEHHSVINTLLDINERFNVTEKDRVLAISNLNFDLSVFDIFGLLLVGGTIVLPEQAKVKNPSHWLELISNQQITIWNSVPMFMQMLVEFLADRKLPSNLSSLRLCLLSGDWIPLSLPEQVKPLVSKKDNFKFVSLGGATECAIWSILFEVNQTLPTWTSIPYGVSMKNQGVSVLDRALEPCPSWVEGDIYISGSGLARGYWNDIDKTNSHFIIHPRSQLRLYRTGDIGRYDADGIIEFLGRKDTQVKLSGHRVELGEIESCLVKHPQIYRAVVDVVPCKGDNQTSLVAFIQRKPYVGKAKLKINSGINDNLAKQAFTLEQRNLRVIPRGAEVFSTKIPELNDSRNFHFRKSYRHYTDEIIDANKFRQLLENFIATSSQENISNKKPAIHLHDVLNRLSAVDDPETPFPRYGYPSAGGLYPVQVYLKIISSNLLGKISPGYYYYHPVKQLLYFINPLSSDDQKLEDKAELFFVGYMPAITPLYGDYSSLLMRLEVGFMLEAIGDNSCNVYQSCPTLHHNFELSRDDHSVLASLKLGRNDGVTDELLSGDGVRVCIYLKANAVKTYAQGLYEFDVITNDLMLISSTFEMDRDSFTGDNSSIFESASFAILFLSNKTARFDERCIAAGKLSQSVMNKTFQTKIGFCPIGSMENLATKEILELTEKTNLIHILLGGVIDNELLYQKSNSVIVDESPLEARQLEILLRRSLPEYMVANHFYEVDCIPLSKNGKVDRKALLKIAKKDVSTDHDSPKVRVPTTNLEKELFEIWKEILQVDDFGVDVHFVKLGGNSLLFVRLANSLHQHYQVEFTLSVLMNNATISKISQLILNYKAINAEEKIQQFETII